MYIAHIREEDKKEQTILEHLEATAEKAAEFGKEFNNSELAYLYGLLHDVGKYSGEFQARIRNEGKRCDHSTAGARLLYEHKPFGVLGAYCIAGHHSGLQNCGSKTDIGGEGTLYGRLTKEYRIPSYDEFEEEIIESDLKLDRKPMIRPINKGGFSISFLIRMLYSTLVDADYLNTEYFMRKGEVDRSANYNFTEYQRCLENYIKKFSIQGLINEKRSEILKCCIDKAKLNRGLFTLTVPTGGGKTVSSFAFALNHLLENNMKRIIYVIPYTSIIEQNAKVFKNIIGEDNVLEHHSNFNFNDNESEKSKQHLSTENWDMPVIVTTNVQFFESLFASKSSKCRKIHNICNSVIIFDEAQMLPTEYLSACISAIAELVQNCNSSVVLCSATQPAITKKFPDTMKCVEICEDTKNLYKTFQRIQIVKRGMITNDNLDYEMDELMQCLCIVNTRKHALKLFRLLKEEGKYHLSTLMCPFHRSIVLKEIRQRLTDKKICRVVSTRLVEAGVDVDFPRVYRSICGLDSIVQAAGRCNREGKLMNEDGEKIKGEVHVFEPEEEFEKRQPESFKRDIEVTKQIVERYEDITSPEAIKEYFDILYKYLGDNGLDIKNIYQRLEAGFSSGKFEYEFETIAEDFKLMEENTFSVIIPYNDEAIAEIESLKYSEYKGKILRKLQGYTVNVYKKEYENLLGAGKLRLVCEGIAELVSMKDYDANTGLNVAEELGVGIYL